MSGIAKGLCLSIAGVVLVVVAVAIVAGRPTAVASSPNIITSPDTAGSTGTFTSVTLDAAGNPVVSYRGSDGQLRVLHCNDANCSGGGESITSPDTTGPAEFTSIALDGAGNPVVSYHAGSPALDLKVLHCNDANCSGNDESITSPDTTGTVGLHTSIALDGGGNPLISYYSMTSATLKVIHCGDANCSAGNLIAMPDSSIDDVGAFSSLALNASGFPMVAYYGADASDLRFLRCNNATCTGVVNVTSPDTSGAVGPYASLEIDSGGNAVVAYRYQTASDLRVLHCGNATCTSGNSITSPDTVGSVGYHVSLELDGAGFPVVAYWDLTNNDLKVLHCNDANCAGANESTTSPDTGGSVGTYASLALDASGRPVVSYFDGTNADLKVLHCGDVNCTGKAPTPTPTNTASHTPTKTSTPTSTKTPTSTFTPTATRTPTNTPAATSTWTPTPSATFTPKNTPTRTPTWTPTPSSTNGPDLDSDGDGCTDVAELQGPSMAGSGGGRDPSNFWDFYDVPTGAGPSKDQGISAPDIFAVIARFNANGDSGTDPLSVPPPAPAYHTAYDRGPSAGPNTWNLTAANGSIAATDVFAVIGQFNHSCA